MFNVFFTEALVFVLLLAIPVIILFLAFRSTPDAKVDEWATAFGVTVDEERRPFIASYLGRTRRLRFGFAALAVLAQGAVRAVVDDPLPWANTFVLAIVGYLVGAIVAEIGAPRLRGPREGAVLAPRRISDYLPRYGLVALAALPILTAAAVAWTIELAPGPRFRDASPRTLVLLVCVSAVLSAIVAVALRMIARRSQPTASPELARLDDALRSSSMHAMDGGAVTLQLLLLAFALGQLQAALTATPGTSSRIALATTIAALLSLTFALGAWAVLGHPSDWRTRRQLGAAT